MFNYIVVGGKFDDTVGKPSGYIFKLASTLMKMNPNGKLYNGGTFNSLKNILNELKDVHVVFWMPDVSNDKEKLVLKIKTINPRVILVTSKNNLNNKYDTLEIISRALMTKSNLVVKFESISGGHRDIHASIYDPLGNCYGDSSNIDRIAALLMNRVVKLLNFTRVNSVMMSDSVEYPVVISEYDKFFEIIKKYAEVFHNCIHPVNTTRLLGNASFRCENGFPSFKTQEGNIFVSRRNIDKREISMDGFVPVCLVENEFTPLHVRYKGAHKPSVDTPIQLMLYRYYENMRFMIHSHTYIALATPTHINNPIPCGAIEEFYEIVKEFPDRNSKLIKINLSGHGSLVMSDSLENLDDIHYMARHIPEGQY